MRRWLATGELDLADYGVDNAIALVENASVDVILVAATDYTPTELVAQPEIKSLADLRGTTVLVGSSRFHVDITRRYRLRSGAEAEALEDSNDGIHGRQF